MTSNGNDPRSWFDGMMSACFSIILALVGLSWAASLIESVWPTLVVILGEGVYADAMEAFTDIMNQVQNQLSGEDIKLKMRNKAKNGGTIGKAKLGYLNVRKDVDGYLVNSIALDSERAPLVRKAFELYATGQYSVTALLDEMTMLGLTTRRTAKFPSTPLKISTLHKMLREQYYAGFIL